MPGIVGVFSPDGLLSEDRSAFFFLTESLKHMPWQKTVNNAYKHLFLGRVDLGIFEGNVNPKTSEDRIVAAIFGELLNPLNERRSLIGWPEEKRNKDIGDTDFLLELYKKDKSKFFEPLRGSFNAVIYDKKDAILILLNDRFGLRPFYYWKYGNELMFSSEVKAILRHPNFSNNIDLAGLADFFHFGFVTGNKTFFEDIHMLPPASILTYKDNKVRLKEYWSLEFEEDKGELKEEDYLEELASVIKDCVKNSTEGNYRFGLPLSGGLDSRAIAACIPKEKYPLLVYTWGTPESQEVKIAKKVTEILELKHHNAWRTPDEFVENFSKSVFMTDGMIPGNLPLSNFLYEKTFMNAVDICLDGLQSISLVTPLRYNPLRDKRNIHRALLPVAPKETLKLILSKHYYNIFNDLAKNSIQDIIDSTRAYGLVDKFHFVDITQSQRRLSNLGFQVKMNFVEIRTPLFDYPIMDMVKKIPSELKKHRYIYYRVFPYLSPDLAAIKTTDSMLPIDYPYWLTMMGRITKAARTRLYKKLNSCFKFDYNRHKLSDWGIDYNYWFTDSSALKAYTKEILLNGNNSSYEYLNKEGIQRILDAQFLGKVDYGTLIGRLLTHMMWRTLFVD